MAKKWFSPKDQNDFPDESGCYAIYCDGNLAYIGSSQNIKKRLVRGHLASFFYSRNEKKWCLPWWELTECQDLHIKCSVRIKNWLQDEIKLIKRLRPKANSKHKGSNK